MSTHDLRVLAISGSLRQDSINTALLRAAAQMAPEGMTIERHDLRGIPLFDQDLENGNEPESVLRFRDAISRADALLIGVPEYNSGITGVLKNALDWASRPSGKSTLPNKTAALVGATPGAGGTRLAQQMTRQILSQLRVLLLPSPAFYLAGAGSKFEKDDSGTVTLTDEASRDFLRAVLEGLAEWTLRVSSD